MSQKVRRKKSSDWRSVQPESLFYFIENYQVFVRMNNYLRVFFSV